GRAGAERGARDVAGRLDLLLLLPVPDRPDPDPRETAARPDIARGQRRQRAVVMGQHGLLLRRRSLHSAGLPVLDPGAVQLVHVLALVLDTATEGLVARATRAEARSPSSRRSPPRDQLRLITQRVAQSRRRRPFQAAPTPRGNAASATSRCASSVSMALTTTSGVIS